MEQIKNRTFLDREYVHFPMRIGLISGCIVKNKTVDPGPYRPEAECSVATSHGYVSWEPRMTCFIRIRMHVRDSLQSSLYNLYACVLIRINVESQK
jgi:hypothetical protein